MNKPRDTHVQGTGKTLQWVTALIKVFKKSTCPPASVVEDPCILHMPLTKKSYRFDGAANVGAKAASARGSRICREKSEKHHQAPERFRGSCEPLGLWLCQ